MIYILSLVATLFVANVAYHSLKRRRFASGRTGWSDEEFAKSLSVDGVSPRVADVVAKVLRNIEPDFGPLANDSVPTTYGLVGEDYTETVKDMIALLGVPLEMAKQTWPPGRVQTVRELAIGLQAAVDRASGRSEAVP